MDAVLNETAKPVVSDKKRQSSHNEPPVLSRCEDPAAPDDGRQAEPCSSPSPPSLLRETYVTRQRSLDLKTSPAVYKFTLQRSDRSSLERRNGATAGFGKLALRLLNKRKKRKQQKQLRMRNHALLGPVIATEGRTTRSRTATSVVSTPASCGNSVSSVDVEVTAGTSRILRPRKSEVNSPATPGETTKLPKSSPLHAPKEVPAKEKYTPEEIDLVDGIEILGFSKLDDLLKYTEAEEALRGPVHLSDEEVDVEYFSDMEEDPTSSSAIVANTLNSFSDSSRMSLFDSSDGEADRSTSRNDDWNMRDLVTDEASCSSSKHATSKRRSKSLDKPEMPKVGQVVNVGLGQRLRPESARNIHHLLDQSNTISRKLAEFSASVVTQKGKRKPETRMVMPVVCSKMLEIMRYRWAIGDRGEQVTLSTAKTKVDAPKPGTSAAGTSATGTSAAVGSIGPQVKKVMQEASTSTSGERPKRKSEIPKRRPCKRRRKIREATATKVAEDNKSESDVEVLEIKKVSKVAKVEEVEDTAKTAAPAIKPKVFAKMEQPPTEVEAIVREMVDFVTLKEEEKPILFDPDQSEGLAALEEEQSAPPTKAPAQKKTRAGLLCELRRLDVTVFDMDEEAAKEPPAEESTSFEGDCKKDTCRLGCVCESLAGRRGTMPTHCGRVDCMFKCSCTSTTYERKQGGRHLLEVSDATLAWIQDESERNLAKVERQFKQTVVRAKDDLIVMGTKRSRREIKMPERYRENFITTKDYLLFETQKVQRKSLTTLTPPLTPTNKSLSPSKLITPPKAPSNKITPPQRPKFDDPPERPGPKSTKRPFRRTTSESSVEDTDSEDDTPLEVRSCAVLLYRMNGDEGSPPRRNIALKSTSKPRHLHNIIQSSARTSGSYTENHRLAKKNENKLATLWNQHSADNEMFCHIVKEHSISPEEWEKSGELAASDEPMSPLKKNANAVQLIPWTYLRDKFRTGEYHIWYKCQQGNNKQKLYLTEGPTKPNKVCVNLRELENPLCTSLPPMIAKLVTADENPEEDDKDARCFLKSLGDFWMIAGYMQRTVGNAPTGIPGNMGMITKMAPSITRTFEEDVVEIDDPQARSKSKKNSVKAQARWWLLHLTQTFDMLVFPRLGLSVTYSQIKKTAALANMNQSSGFIRMTLKKNSNNKFGLYGVPGMPECVLIGPYALDQPPGFKAYTQRTTTKKKYIRVPIYCANKDSEYELETRKIATPECLLRIPQRVIGTWLYDFKSLELPRPVSTPDKHMEKNMSDEVPGKNAAYFSCELKSRLEEKPKQHAQSEPKPKASVSVPTHPSRTKARSGQSLLKGNEEVKTINKNTLSVKIDGKAKEALVRVEEDVEMIHEETDPSKRGKLKIRQDLMKSSTSPPAPVPESRTSNASLPRKSSTTENVVDLEDDELDGSPQAKEEPKKDYIVSNIKRLGFIPVTYVSDSSVFIPHFSVPGQVHFFRSHDEVVKFVYQAVRQKITFIGFRPETISWRQVDSLNDVKGEKQFNPGVLVGNHVITKAGLLNLVKLTEEEIPTLDLLPKEAEELSAKLDHIKSLPLLRQLGRLLVGPKAGPMPQNAIVFMAVSEIQKLAAQGTVLKNKRKGLLDERHKIEETLKALMKGLPEDERLKAQNEIDAIRTDKPVIVLDEDSETEEQAAPARKTGFAANEMVNLSSDDDCEVETIPRKVKKPARVQTKVSSVPSTVVTSKTITTQSNPSASTPTTASTSSTSAITTPSTSSTNTITAPSTSSTNTITAPSTSPAATPSTSSTGPAEIPSTSSTSSVTAPVSRPSQSLICKFPFSPLKRVNVTVKEDGIVATSTTNTMIQLNQPIRTLNRSADGTVIKAIKIVDPSSLKQIPACQTRIAPARTGQSIIRPNMTVAPGMVQKIQQKIPILRTVPRAGLSATSDVRPRAVFMTRTGAAVPMTIVRPKTGEPYVKLVTPNSEKVFITSSLPVVKSSADLRAAGLKVLHPNIPTNQHLGSPPKPNVIRILKSPSSTATVDNSVKDLLSPKKVATPSPPAMPAATSIAEIDTTELVID